MKGTNKLRKSYKFDVLSLLYKGVYYFPSDIEKSEKRKDKPYEIQGVFYSGKWKQDTFYITEQFKEMLMEGSK